jgi:hypothetical protein
VPLASTAPAIDDWDALVRKKVDCTKPENKSMAACKPKRGDASTDEVFNAGYWMARQGQYGEARVQLSRLIATYKATAAIKG